jgi:hypothetical protein
MTLATAILPQQVLLQQVLLHHHLLQQAMGFGSGCIGKKGITGRNPTAKRSIAWSAMEVPVGMETKCAFKIVAPTIQSYNPLQEMGTRQI